MLCIGNHELYNFAWEELESLLNKDEPESVTHQVSEEGRFYYAIRPFSGWKILQLNPFEVSMMQDKVLPGFQEAKTILQKHNPSYEDFLHEFDPDVEQKAAFVDYFKGLEDDLLHFVPFNGGLSQTQIDWLKNELASAYGMLSIISSPSVTTVLLCCVEKKEKVIILTHVPLSREASGPKTLIFNHEEVLALFKAFPNVVRLVLSGHRHEGGYHFDEDLNLAHVTLRSPLICGDSFGVISVFEDRIKLEGTEMQPSKDIYYS